MASRVAWAISGPVSGDFRHPASAPQPPRPAHAAAGRKGTPRRERQKTPLTLPPLRFFLRSAPTSPVFPLLRIAPLRCPAMHRPSPFAFPGRPTTAPAKAPSPIPLRRTPTGSPGPKNNHPRNRCSGDGAFMRHEVRDKRYLMPSFFLISLGTAFLCTTMLSVL